MARGFLKEKEYRMTDIEEFIRKQMKVTKQDQLTVARKMGHTQSWFSKKLCKGTWEMSELLDLFKIIQAEADMVGRLFIL